MTRDAVHELAQGRVWTGRQAEARGLVDELGGLDRAVAVAKDRAGIDANDEVELVVYPRERSFLDLLSEGFTVTQAAARRGWSLQKIWWKKFLENFRTNMMPRKLCLNGKTMAFSS